MNKNAASLIHGCVAGTLAGICCGIFLSVFTLAFDNEAMSFFSSHPYLTILLLILWFILFVLAVFAIGFIMKLITPIIINVFGEDNESAKADD